MLRGRPSTAARACKITAGLLAEFGPRRVRNTPVSEEGFTGVAVGAAMLGLRPVVEIMTINFSLLAIDQSMNNAAKLRSLSGGRSCSQRRGRAGASSRVPVSGSRPTVSSAMQTLGSANGCKRSDVTGARSCPSTPCIRPRCKAHTTS